MSNYLTPEFSFLSFIGTNFTSDWNLQHHQLNNGIQIGNHISVESTHMYFEFWTINPDYFKPRKKGTPNLEDNQTSIVGFEIFGDFPTVKSPNDVRKYEYDSEGHLRN
jgi:hypothetical protein